MRDLSVAILAGGQSTRFGTPKIEAQLNHRSLLDIAIQTASKISDKVMLICGCSPIHGYRNFISYMDIIPGCGPMGGLFTALHYTDKPFLASFPCDMPFLSAELYQILHKVTLSARPAVALSTRGMEPLLAIWPVQLSLPCLEVCMKDGKYSLFRALKQLNAAEVNIPENIKHYHPDLFCNINYQEDLHRVQNRARAINVR
jgi:molybdopterin-guanine dinucleotide biosynthesis protein A